MRTIPLYFYVFIFCCCTCIAFCQQQPTARFRDELFPEQLLQQQLQFKAGAIQQQLQELQRQFQVNRDNGIVFNSLIAKQNAFLQDLADIQNQLLVLQQQIQDQISGVHKYKFADISIITQKPIEIRKEVRPIVVVQDTRQSLENILPLIDRKDVSTNQVSETPIIVVQEEVIPAIQDELEIPCTSSAGGSGFCKPLVRCLAFYADLPELRKQPCALRENEFGVCCPLRERTEAPFGSGRTGILHAPPSPPVDVPSITRQEIERTITIALDKVFERKSFVSTLFLQRVLVPSGSAAAWHQELFPTSNETLEIGEGAQKNVEASVELVNEFKLSPKQGTFALPKFSVLNTVLADTCPKTARCRAHKYRSTDGSCNNLNHQQWGAPGTALQRILPPKYGDGVNSPISQDDNGFPLPSARLVSVLFAQDRDSPSDNYTLLLMQWGQFVDHDLTHTPISRGHSGFGISCCRNGKLIEASLRHPDCFAIDLPTDDHIFSKFGERCMEFVRSLPAPRPECNFGPREQMNQVTGYLDGSSVYASSLDSQRNLRSFKGGRLKAQNIRGRELLPANPTECSNDLDSAACFSAGDGRVNEQIELALMHTVWMREHNRIADVLAQQHPNWSDEAVFQETRRIVVAEMQHITYNEFLPVILGQAYMDYFQLSPKDSSWTQIYDPDLNGGITNVFATAAFRFGHTMIQHNIHGYGKFGNIRENLQLSKQHFAPFSLYRDSGVDDFVRGFTFQSAQSFDRFFSKEITDRLFQGGLNFGLDLVALNIQRGRDHGLPPYNDWREVCGLKRANSWNDLDEIMDTESIQRLATLYNNVNDVELFVGGVAERPMPGAFLGPTLVCLIGDQFSRLRRGDRFYYEEAGQPSSFSEGQVNEIRKVSLARILCDNSDNVVVMQPLAFWKPSYLNQRIPCDSQAIPKMDLSAWINESPAIP